MTALIWRETTINGARTIFADAGNARVYIRETKSTVQAWADSRKIANCANVAQAKQVLTDHLAGRKTRLIQETAPVSKSPRIALTQDPREVGPPRKMLVGKTEGRKPPVRVEEEVKLHRYPIADMSKPPVVETAPIITTISIPPPTTKTKFVGRCNCGAVLGRYGKCPALCEPVPDPAPRYSGPMVVMPSPKHTHTGRLGAPVWTPSSRHTRDGWIG